MLNEMWVKCSGFPYFSLFIAWAAGSSFYLLGINGWCILILFNLFLFARDWVGSSTPPSIYFFLFEDTWIHSPFSYLHDFHSAFCSNVFFLASTPIIFDLPLSNGNTFPNQCFPPAYTIFQVGSWEFHQSCRESLWKVGYPAAALAWMWHKPRRHLVGCPHCLHLQLLPSCLCGPWSEYSNIIPEYSSCGCYFEPYLGCFKVNQANLL